MAKTFVQYGSGYEPGLLVYRAQIRRQHGYGLGSFLGRMFRHLLPIARDIFVPHAVSAAQNVLNDVSNGNDLRGSLKSNGIGLLKGVANSVINQKGQGRQRRRKRKIRAATPFSNNKRRKITFAPIKRRPSKKPTKLKTKKDFVSIFD